MYGPFFLTYLQRHTRVTPGPGCPRDPQARRRSGRFSHAPNAPLPHRGQAASGLPRDGEEG